MPTYRELQILDKVCEVTRQKQIKYYDFIPFFDFQYEKNIFNCQPSHFSPCSARNVRVTEPGRRPFVLIAHNFQGYDGYLLLEELYRQAVVPSQIVNGAKLLSVAIPGGIKFIDSLNFFPMALASFPQTFGLREEAKGFFPHFFNVPTSTRLEQ